MNLAKQKYLALDNITPIRAGIDLEMYGGIAPPALVPVSSRAKSLLGDSPLVILGTPEDLTAKLPDDYMVAMTEVKPEVVRLVAIEEI